MYGRYSSDKEFRNLISSPPCLFVFSSPSKRVISAVSAVSRNFTVVLTSHSAYKYKLPEQPCQVSPLLYDTYLTAPSQPASAFSPLPNLQASKSVTVNVVPKRFSRCALPCNSSAKSSSAGSHHPAHIGRGRGGEGAHHPRAVTSLVCTSAKGHIRLSMT